MWGLAGGSGVGCGCDMAGGGSEVRGKRGVEMGDVGDEGGREDGGGGGGGLLFTVHVSMSV